VKTAERNVQSSQEVRRKNRKEMDETFERESISQKLEGSAAPITERKSKESEQEIPNEQLMNDDH
jgi:hypothetical protein